MESKTKELMIEKYWNILKKISWITEKSPGENEVAVNSLMYKDIEIAMQEYADQETKSLRQELEEKEKENARLGSELSERLTELGVKNVEIQAVKKDYDLLSKEFSITNSDLHNEKRLRKLCELDCKSLEQSLNDITDKSNKNRSIIDDIQKKDGETIAIMANKNKSLLARLGELEEEKKQYIRIIKVIDNNPKCQDFLPIHIIQLLQTLLNKQ